MLTIHTVACHHGDFRPASQFASSHPHVVHDPLPQGTVKVLAQKARTQVKWTLLRTFPVTSP